MPGTAMAKQDKTVTKFNEKDLKKNINLFKQKVIKFCENEKLEI